MSNSLPETDSVAIEQRKYNGIFGAPQQYPHYGKSNHGKNAIPFIETLRPSSILDVGCGWNNFNKDIKRQIPDLLTTGVDFACPGADINASATNLPFLDKAFTIVTAFDVLEHLPPDKVELALSELARVADHFVFSIAYVPSRVLWQGLNLHPTVQPESWWLEKIAKAGGTDITKMGKYIAGKWHRG